MNAPHTFPAVSSADSPSSAAGAPTRCELEDGATGNRYISPALLDELSRLNDRQMFAVLGVLLDQHVPPARISEEMWELLEPVSDAFDKRQVYIAVEMGWIQP
jgi:hypothetical protein